MNPAHETPDRKAAILRARARELAREPVDQRVAASSLEVVVFALAHERYAIETGFVSEVHPLEDLTPLPCAPPFVRGLVNVRGRILAVIDLKRFFDLPEHGITDLHCIVLLRTADMEFGLLADLVVGTRVVPLDAVQPPPPTLADIRAEYLKGVTADRLIILDTARILADPRIIVHDELDA